MAATTSLGETAICGALKTPLLVATNVVAGNITGNITTPNITATTINTGSLTATGTVQGAKLKGPDINITRSTYNWDIVSSIDTGVEILRIKDNGGISVLNIGDDGFVKAENFTAVGGQIEADEGVVSNGVLQVSPNPIARLVIGARDANWAWGIQSSEVSGEQTLQFLDNDGNPTFSINQFGNVLTVGNITATNTLSGGDIQVIPNANARLLIGSRSDPNWSWDIRSDVELSGLEVLRFYNNTGAPILNINENGTVSSTVLGAGIITSTNFIQLDQNINAKIEIGSTTPLATYPYHWTMSSLAVAGVETLGFFNFAGQAVLSLKDNLDAVFLNNILMSPYTYVRGGLNTPALQFGSIASPIVFQYNVIDMIYYAGTGLPIPTITDNYQRIITYGIIDNSSGSGTGLLVRYSSTATNYQFNTATIKTNFIFRIITSPFLILQGDTAFGIAYGPSTTLWGGLFGINSVFPNGTLFTVEFNLELNNP